MKTYSAPRLVEIGSVIEQTQGSFIGRTDPSELDAKTPVGSVGFSL